MEMSDTIKIRPAEAQPEFCKCEHDSLQYHFFANGRCYAARLFVTPTLHHTSLWFYNGIVQQAFISEANIHQTSSKTPDVQVDSFTLNSDDKQGTISITDSNLHIHFQVNESYAWSEPIGTVVHQPNLTCSIVHDDESMSGVGYCKRYCWNGFPSHWGYRFFHGSSHKHSDFVWTADATFGTKKYAYFKVLKANGELLAARVPDSCHRDNAAYATVDGAHYSLRTEILGTWETRLQSSTMDSQMTQHYCSMTLSNGQESIQGVALNELCFGTLG